MTDANPRAVAGDNRPAPGDIAKREAEKMAVENAEMADTAARLLAEARSLPETVDDDRTMNVLSTAVVAMRDLRGRVLDKHRVEKEPHLRAGQGVDQFFFGMRDRLDQGMRVLSKRVDDWNQRKLAAERKRREEEERVAREKERVARERLEAEQRAVREAELAADRARLAARKAEHTAEAEARERAAAAAQAEAKAAQQRADEARLASTAPSSAIVRHRDEETGRLTTMKQVGYVEVTDRLKLDWLALAPFLKQEVVDRVVKQWAETHAFRTPMAGAIIEMRDVTQIR